MIAFFVSVLSYDSAKRFWWPKIFTLAEGLGLQPNNAFSTTSANTSWISKPVAIGLIEATASDLASYDGATDVWCFDMANWKTKLVSDITIQHRNKLQNLLTDRNMAPDIQVTDTVEQAFVKLYASMPDNTLPTIYTLIAEYDRKYGASGL
jgi:hypothetical protein